MTYLEQWKTLRRAIALGWLGCPPSVLGGYYADKTVREAEAFVAEHERKEAEKEAVTKKSRGVYGEWCHDPKLCAGKSYCPRDPTCAD